MKNNDIGKLIKDNTKRLIDKKIIKNKKDLEDLTLDQVCKIANELNICVKSIICCYCTFENCIGDTQFCKYEKL
ncbi:hypothetical protein [Clostridium botulinum]|uniref:hypothetical protein n=1 Tax=Clostridium botulinum TaxID=1491 RepID=UPI001E286D33|nr:hypothetical protein [Clostridium botulinum]MCC5416512.1 hypothetical protein [Clostridium botulinum]HCL4578491.1 hypothetical protein [Clostridium botulinum]HDI4925029.1 hypothetical protein [Clostridium botulinum]